MGYSYGRNDNGNMVLSCDSCGSLGGVRKRKCRFTVLGSSRGFNHGVRYALPYCYPPALCSACFKREGGSKGIHTDERCGAGARASQVEADAEEAIIASGAPLRIAAINMGGEMVKVTFRTNTGERTEYAMSVEAYHAISLLTPATPDSYRALGFELILLEPVIA